VPEVPDEWREAASDSARRQEERWEEASPGPGVTDQQDAGTEADPFASEEAPYEEAPYDEAPYDEAPYDEASYDWVDPGFGRPPRHLRRRLGRFFRRNPRPR
jgi:hypothetical protein